MKWQPVNKTLWLFVLALTVGLMGTFAWHVMHTPHMLMSKHQSSVKIGFVDLMSHKHEIYNVDLQVLDDCIMTTFTEPGDDTFVLKGNLVEVKKENNRYNYKYSPIFTSTEVKKSMAYEFIETLSHTDIWLQVQKDNKQLLLIGQEGVVFPL